MTQQTRVTVDLKEMDKLLKALGKEYVTKVGFIGSQGSEVHADSEGLSNAEIAFIHEFGSQTRNIPQRSIMQMPLHQKQKEIIKELKKGKAGEALNKGDAKSVYKALGIIAQNIINEAFASGGFGKWAPNKPATIERKGSSSPLIDTAQLRRAVSSEVVKRSEVQ